MLIYAQLVLFTILMFDITSIKMVKYYLASPTAYIAKITIIAIYVEMATTNH
jgi:hypothetical protein